MDNFNDWLAGFIDGEGHFDIRPVKGRTAYFCRFVLTVRADERGILKEIVDHTGIGIVSPAHHGKNGSNPQLTWTAFNKTDCRALVELLDSHPLRAKKKRDYELWREAVLEWSKQKRLPNNYDWSRIVSLREDLMQGRKYQEI
jgi:hypothetical protein